MVESHTTGEISLAREPCILVTVACNGDQILKASLSPASSFSYKFIDPSPKLENELVDWLKEYAKGKNQLPPLHLKADTFTQKVLNFLARIPLGKVVSYQEIAKFLGTPKASRAVGNACRSNPFPLFIPCHRVVGSNGTLGGFSCGLELKKGLLKFESEI